MNYKKIILFVASCFIIFLYFNTDFYGQWFNTKIMNAITPSDYPNEMDHLDFQLDHLGLEERKEARLGSTYVFSKNVAEFLKKQHAKDPLVLLPPQGYLKANNVNLLSLEPIVFYYYCGVKGALITSKNANEANWAVVINGSNVSLEPIKSKEQLNYILKLYSQYQ